MHYYVCIIIYVCACACVRVHICKRVFVCVCVHTRGAKYALLALQNLKFNKLIKEITYSLTLTLAFSFFSQQTWGLRNEGSDKTSVRCLEHREVSHEDFIGSFSTKTKISLGI